MKAVVALLVLTWAATVATTGLLGPSTRDLSVAFHHCAERFSTGVDRPLAPCRPLTTMQSLGTDVKVTPGRDSALAGGTESAEAAARPEVLREVVQFAQVRSLMVPAMMARVLSGFLQGGPPMVLDQSPGQTIFDPGW